MAESQGSLNDVSTSGWKRPDELMKLHLLKKKKALNARLCRKPLPATTNAITNPNDDVFAKRNLFQKRKNPFRCEVNKRFKGNDGDSCTISNISCDLENSNDTTLFQLITANSTSESQQSNESMQTSFASILSKLKGETSEPIGHNENTYIPIDWSLKSKIRLMSEKPFPWNLKLKTCEEASGITGFVRCVNSGLSPEKNNSPTCSLDTSPNARFHQCCLVWQYPSFPWLSLFPRITGRVSSTSSSFVNANPELRDCLYREWCENFRSLFQLVRALQCPYFYVCANSFTCLFRAAGISGQTDIHAFVTPTTSGFRQLLKNEDVEYTMPLRKTKYTKRLSSDSNSDTGYDTLDSIADDRSQDQNPKASITNEDDDDEDDDETADEWLKSMGMEASEIKKLNAQQEKLTADKAREIDQSPESLVYVEGVEVQALFNFLMNCKSTVAPTGPLAGIPPTLLSPVAFRGASLKPFKVLHNKVKVDTQSYYSIEIRGPILPHTVHNLCGLLKQSQSFSMTFAHVESTKPFSQVASVLSNETKTTVIETSVRTPEKSASSVTVHTPTKTPTSNALCKENLSDCGLHRALIYAFCCPDETRIRIVDSLRSNIDGTYNWS